MNAITLPNPTGIHATIKLGIDAHAKWFSVGRQAGGATPQPVQKMAFDGLLRFVAKQQGLAREVFTCYGAGAFGYHLHRKLTAMGVTNYVVQPQDWDERGKGVKNDRSGALALCGRLQAMGRSLLASHGIHVTGKWWTGKTWKLIGEEAPEWAVERLEVLTRLVAPMEAEEKAMTEAIQEKGAEAAIPRGAGPLTFEVLRREEGDWPRFNNYPGQARALRCGFARLNAALAAGQWRQVSSYTGPCPREHSSGGKRRGGSVSKKGNPRVRATLVEMVWRMMRWQPDYIGPKKWMPVLGDASRSAAARKKATVAVARQLAVDLWRLFTGQATAEKLGLVYLPEAT